MEKTLLVLFKDKIFPEVLSVASDIATKLQLGIKVLPPISLRRSWKVNSLRGGGLRLSKRVEVLKKFSKGRNLF